jgi:hypothetical protein
MVNAIYFKDKDVTHLNIDTLYDIDHFLVNGETIMPQVKNRYKGGDIIVEGRITEFKVAHKKTIVSHYMNRENGETMPIMRYIDTIASFKNENGEYKDLDSEYLCRKMEQQYVAVSRTYFEYEDVAFQYIDAELQPDDYVRCEGIIKENPTKYINGLPSKRERFFLYKFSKWRFCCDLIVRLMEEYGIVRVKEDAKDKPREYYVLHESTSDYQWLEFCGDKYFIRNEDILSKRDNYPPCVYGTYGDCLKMEKDIEEMFRRKIETKLDNVRTISVKVSDMRKFYDDLKHLATSADIDKKKTKSAISGDLRMILYDVARIANIKN